MTGFGDRLRRLRHEAGLSQIELAGDDLSPSYISLMESGKRQPSPEVVRVLAERLRCSVEALESDTPARTRRQIELELSYAKLALSNGEAESARTRLESLLGGDRDMDQVSRDDVTYLLALALEKTGDLEGAAARLLPVYRRCLSGDSHLPVASVGMAMCWFYSNVGDLHAAVRAAEDGMRAVAAQKLEGTDEHLRLASTLMSVYYDLGDLAQSSAWAEELLGIAERSGSRSGQAAIYWNAAHVAEAQGRTEQALHFCERALALVNDEVTNRDLPRLRVAVAFFLLRSDPRRAREAAAILDGTHDLLADLGSPVDLATWSSTRAAAALLLGDPAEGERLARKALLHLSTHPSLDSARALTTLGDCLVAQGQQDDAVSHYEAAGTVLDTLPPSRQVAAAWREIGDRMALAGRSEDAVAGYRKALDRAGVPGGGVVAEVAFHGPQVIAGLEPAPRSPLRPPMAGRPAVLVEERTAP